MSLHDLRRNLVPAFGVDGGFDDLERCRQDLALREFGEEIGGTRFGALVEIALTFNGAAVPQTFR